MSRQIGRIERKAVVGKEAKDDDDDTCEKIVMRVAFDGGIEFSICGGQNSKTVSLDQLFSPFCSVTHSNFYDHHTIIHCSSLLLCLPPPPPP